MNCPHLGKTDGRLVECKLLSSAAGFRVSVNMRICERCVHKGENLKKQIAKDGTPRLFQIMKGALTSRLLSFDCPRFQKANPVDIHDAFRRYAAVSTAQERRDLFKAIVRRQSAIPESEGGHPHDVLARKLGALAEEHGDSEALEEAIHEHAAAKKRIPRRDAR